ncbi:hypothetical protein [Paenibacillus xylanexedens]|uniref:hypothetical protein n=1 Tax=Paenibacillus xylanexedens TaxID=528191 RepID=UPI0011A5CB84|nr:hypothetical protein [Paenibacillus xylanexedens]
MDTKIINNKINEVINSDQFKELQWKVVDDIFSSINTIEFENNDDLKLVMTRIRDTFIAGLNYESAKQFLNLAKSGAV